MLKTLLDVQRSGDRDGLWVSESWSGQRLLQGIQPFSIVHLVSFNHVLVRVIWIQFDHSLVILRSMLLMHLIVCGLRRDKGVVESLPGYLLPLNHNWVFWTVHLPGSGVLVCVGVGCGSRLVWGYIWRSFDWLFGGVGNEGGWHGPQRP
jgi:hypothetical protein